MHNKVNKGLDVSGKLETMLKDIEEVKALFVFGEKVIPVLQELFIFLAEIIPILSEMRNSLESSHREMPQIIHKLDNITEETEIATNQILDSVDIISAKLNENQESIQILQDSAKRSINEGKIIFEKALALYYLNKEILDKVKNRNPIKLSEYQQKNSEIMVELKEILKQHLENIKGNESKVEELSNENMNISNLAFEIMNALQFQDITTQQIRHANNVISIVENKIVSLLNKFESTTIHVGSLKKSKTDKYAGTYDPNATLKSADIRQSAADELFVSQEEEQETTIISQNEIDNLLNKKEEIITKEANLVNYRIEEAEEKTNENEEVSQDEIDKLLSGNNPKKDDEQNKESEIDEKKEDNIAVSQDEIDRLLSGDL